MINISNIFRKLIYIVCYSIYFMDLAPYIFNKIFIVEYIFLCFQLYEKLSEECVLKKNDKFELEIYKACVCARVNNTMIDTEIWRSVKQR